MEIEASYLPPHEHEAPSRFPSRLPNDAGSADSRIAPPPHVRAHRSAVAVSGRLAGVRAPIKAGDEVEGRWAPNGRWYDAVVENVLPEEKVLVDWAPTSIGNCTSTKSAGGGGDDGGKGPAPTPTRPVTRIHGLDAAE